MKCDRFDDLVATNALLRPGPLDSGMHLVFIRRKRGEETVRYPHDALREVLGPTYGVIVYQEQVMRIANVLGGYSLAERSEEHTSELQSRLHLVCRLLLEKKKQKKNNRIDHI